MNRAAESRPTTVERTLRHGDLDRRYLLCQPRPEASGLPLVVELHGRGIDPGMFDRWTGYGELAEAEGFVLAMPYALHGVWNDGRFNGPGWSGLEAVDDVGFVLAIADELIAAGTVDAGRVYLVGMSNGAAMAGRLAWQHADRFAAVAQVAGTASSNVVATAGGAGPVPIMEIHGTRDRANPYDGGGPTGLLMRLLIRRRADPAIAVEEWARLWIERNRVDATPIVEHIGPDVTLRTWHGASPASDLAFYRIDGAGHTWPGVRIWSPPHLGRVSRTIDATSVTWDFLSAHSR